jgi:hypothetical protein
MSIADRPGAVNRYLTSRKNLAGSALGLVGVGLALAGVIPGVLPALGIIAGLYVAGALAMPERKSATALDGGVPVDVDEINKALRRLSGVAQSAPPDIAAKTQGIITQLQELVPRVAGQSAGTDAVYVLSRMATNYLPDTLDVYLRLPRNYAETQKLAGGQTAHQMVSAQLDLLAEKVTEVTSAILKGDSDALAAHGRFLAERFAPSALQLSPGSGSPS